MSTDLVLCGTGWTTWTQATALLNGWQASWADLAGAHLGRLWCPPRLRTGRPATMILKRHRSPRRAKEPSPCARLTVMAAPCRPVRAVTEVVRTDPPVEEE